MRKLKKFLSLLLFLLSLNQLCAQVNTEKMRLWADSSGFSGNLLLASKLIKGNSDLFFIDAKVNFLYRHKKHLFFSLNNFSQTRSNDNKLIDKGFSLFRYNYEFTDKYILELFTQAEFNHLRKLDHRFLLGAAFRYVPFHHEKIYTALGFAMMREEEAIEDSVLVKARQSTYLTFEFQINEIIKFSNTFYYQPKIDGFSDFRVLNEGKVSFLVFKRLEIWMSVQYRYDSEPPALIEHYDIDFRNGIKFNF